jgi:hypothetical protein
MSPIYHGSNLVSVKKGEQSVNQVRIGSVIVNTYTTTTSAP